MVPELETDFSRINAEGRSGESDVTEVFLGPIKNFAIGDSCRSWSAWT
jgi:hypothetical protein